MSVSTSGSIKSSVPNTTHQKKRRGFAASCLAAAAMAAVGLAPTAYAGNVWTGSNSQDWNDAANWGGSAPAGNLVINNAGLGVFPLINGVAPSLIGVIDINVAITGNTGRLDQRTDVLSTGNGNWMRVGVDANSQGTYNLADTGVTGESNLTTFGTGSGSLNVGGTSTNSGRLTVGAGNGAVGTVNMNTTGTLKLEDDGIGLLMGDGGTSTGNFKLDAGTLQINGVGTSIGILVGTNGGDGNFSQAGGTTNVTGGVWLGDNNAGSQGVMNLSGGTFNMTGTSAVGSTGNGQLFVGRGLGQGTLTVSGTAAVTITGAANVGFTNTATAGTSGLVSVTGGNFTVTGDMRVGSAQNANGVVAAGTGTFNVSGGTANVNGVLRLASGNDAGDVVTGSSTVSGGTLNVQNDLVLAFAGNNNLGQMTISGSGVVNVGTTTERWMVVNQWDTSRGQLTVNGGTLNLNANTDLRFSAGNSTGASVVTLTSGAITSYSGNGTGTASTGVLDLNRAGNLVNNTFNLDGGVLTVAKVLTNSNNGTAVFNFNGGTLKASNQNTANAANDIVGTNFIDLGGASQRVNVRNLGATIDSDVYNVTASQALLHSNVGGDNAIDGGLTKLGSGVLTLTATNTYTGPTTISAGTLQIGSGGAVGSIVGTSAIINNGALIINRSDSFTMANASSGSGTLTKLGAGTLTLSGANTHTGLTTVSAGTLAFTTNASSIGDVVVNDGTGLSVKAASASQTALTTTNLTLGQAGSTSLTFDFSGLNPTVTQIATGGLTLNGSITPTLLNTTGLVGGSTYQLINYSGTLGGSFAALNNTVFNFGHTQATITENVTDADSIDLVVIGDSIEWSGTGIQTWKTATTGDNTPPNDWAMKNGNTATNFWANDAVEFNDTYNIGGGDTAVVNRTVAIDGSVNPTTVIFNNSTGDYTLNGTGSIDGAATVTKNGTSKVSINTANAYTGGTEINSGTLAINSASSLGAASGALTINAGTLQSTANITATRNITLSDATSTIEVDSGTTYSTTGVLSGTGALTKSGTGTLVLGSANTYSGGTNVNAGTLKITTTAGSANVGTFNLNGGTFLVDLGINPNFNYAPAINVLSTSTFGNGAAGSNANTQGQINYTGALNTNGNTLNIANTGLARLYINGVVTGGGQLNVQSGAMGFDINAGNSRGTTAVNIANGAALWFAGNNANPITNPLTFNGGTGTNGGGAFYYEGGVPAPAAVSSAINLAGGNTAFGSGFADTITLSGIVSGPGDLTKVGIGRYILTNANTYTGATFVNGGTLQGNGTNQQTFGPLSSTSSITVNNGGTLAANENGLFGWGGASEKIITVNTGGTMTAGTGVNVNVGVVTLNGGTMANSGPAAVWGSWTFRHAGDKLDVTENSTVSAQNVFMKNGAPIEVASGKTLNFTGTLTNTNNDGIGALIKNGAGTLVLAGANTYTGTTSITGGTVVVNGSLANTAVTLASGANLGGSGTIGGSVTVDGTLAPGNSIESLATGAVSFGSGSTFAYELDSAVLNGDLLDSSGSLSITGGSILTLSELASGPLADGQKLTLISYTGEWNGGLFTYNGNPLTDDSSFTLGSNVWTFNYNDTTGGSNFAAEQDGATGFVTMTVGVVAVPEPATFGVVGALGAIGLLKRRRRVKA